MHSDRLSDYIHMQSFPKVAQEALDRALFGESIAPNTPKEIVQLKAYYRAMERLISPAIERIRNSSFDNDTVVDAVHKRGLRDVMADGLPMVDHAIEKEMASLADLHQTIRAMDAWCTKGDGNTQKMAIRRALPDAFIRDSNTILGRISDHYAQWSNALKNHAKAHGAMLDDDTAALITAASSLANEAALRSRRMNIQSGLVIGR